MVRKLCTHALRAGRARSREYRGTCPVAQSLEIARFSDGSDSERGESLPRHGNPEHVAAQVFGSAESGVPVASRPGVVEQPRDALDEDAEELSCRHGIAL